MSKRWYISPVIGDGTWENPYRPAIREALTENGAGGVWEIASNPDGTPKFPFALCRVGAINHGPLAGVANVDQFPDITLDSTLSVLTANQRNALLNFLSKRGISTTGLTTSATFREVLDRVGKYLNASFNADAFDVNAN